MKDGSKAVKTDPKKQGIEGDPPKSDHLFDDLAPPEMDPKDAGILKMLQDGKKYREIQKELKVSQGRIAKVASENQLLGEQRRREEVKKSLLLFDDEFMGAIIEQPFDFLAKRYGEQWKLSIEEKKKLGVLCNKVSSKYLPLWLERFADEIALLLTIGTVVYPRYLMTKAMLEKPEEIKDSKPEIQPMV
jgi:hypothetical protein